LKAVTYAFPPGYRENAEEEEEEPVTSDTPARRFTRSAMFHPCTLFPCESDQIFGRHGLQTFFRSKIAIHHCLSPQLPLSSYVAIGFVDF
jgi:hypothetical protein